MKRTIFPPRGFIIAGLAIFVVGLVIILRENPLSGLISQLVPDSQSSLIFGAVIVSLGQAIVVLGATKSNSSKLLSNLKSENQLTMTILTGNMTQLQAKMQNERQILMTNYNQTNTKLDHFIATQKQLTIPPQPAQPSNCKFCGAKIEQSTFCKNCGKANY